jgi:transcriptional regulator with XRE-family HTH domain
LNELLRRALFRARLSEEDVAAHLGVDPKTVRRWLEGRLPYLRHRQALSRLIEAKIRTALALYRPLLDVGNVKIRLHRATLCNSLYRADDDLLVNQHAYGIPAANAPVFHLRSRESSGIFTSYISSFEKIWYLYE